ncbi:MAG: hypothetical protein FWF51_13180 [Chitinivibrionia bacterium]|nr:hypothetical protein [Chitinivibrionia bacterium]
MKLRIIVTLTYSLAIMLPITAMALRGNPVLIDLIFILFLCMGTFLFVASFNFCLINLVDALLFVLGKSDKNDYSDTYLRLLHFTILLDIIIYITELYKYDIIILIIPNLICAILCFVYYFNRNNNNLNDEKIEISSKKMGTIYGFSAFVAFNNVLFFISNSFGIKYTFREFFACELLILLILFIITKINRKTKEAEDNQVKKTSDFFLGFYVGGAVGAIGSIIILIMIILLSFCL